ncbi:MAG TPA: hypothetical protein VGZ26_08910 [Pirellulales bacterium]|jgi:hypothetical protein|nr:hypothetical protein [Pirellulales bacterium]
MIKPVTDYLVRLAAGLGEGWTRFWFTPSDPATLSAIRLFTGAIVVYLHATLSFDLIRFFGPAGLLDSGDIRPLEAGSFSYLNYLSTPGELWTAHLIGLAVLIMFMAGWWTRITSVLALVVFLSDIHRAAMITGRTESIAAMVMCYLCLAPCGRRFSLDRLSARRAALAGPAGQAANQDLSTSATIATRLIQVHLALLVAMMGFSKLLGEVWWSGGGVWWLIARPESRSLDLTWLYATPKVIDFWTHAVVLFELGFPVLIWVPLARPLLLAIAAVVWTSLALITGETTFAMMLMIASMAFISPGVLGVCCRRSVEPPAASAAPGGSP